MIHHVFVKLPLSKIICKYEGEKIATTQDKVANLIACLFLKLLQDVQVICDITLAIYIFRNCDLNKNNTD